MGASCSWLTKSCFLFVGALCALRAENSRFADKIKRYYCSADWVCKEFERMPAKEFAQSWVQLVGLLSQRHYRWFYDCDTPVQYQQKTERRYSTIMRYNAESMDMFWVRECVKYHEFLKNHAIDTERGILIVRDEKQSQTTGEQLADKRFVQARLFLTGASAESIFLFYSFFFEQLANVMINTMNYIYEYSHENQEYILELAHQMELLTTIYYLCVHATDQSSEQAQKVVYHYRRIESMVSMVALDLLQREFA